MNYERNKAASRIRNSGKSMTDQSQAEATNINVIVRRFMGQLPPPRAMPMTGDFTNFPTDLRTAIELAKSMRQAKARLPQQLRSLSDDELLKLSADDIAAKLKPADKPADTPADKPKETNT